MRSSSIYKNIWGRLPFSKLLEVIFHLQNYLRLPSIYKMCWGCLPFTRIFEVVFHLQKYLRSSSIYKISWDHLQIYLLSLCPKFGEILKVEYLSNLNLYGQAMFYKSFKWRQPQNIESGLSQQPLYGPWVLVLRGKLEENSKEISSVALLSPACFSISVVHLFDTSFGACYKLTWQEKFIFS